MAKDMHLPFLKQELQSTKEPFFLWIHSSVPRGSIDPPIPYIGHFRKSPESAEQLHKAFDRSPGSLEVIRKLRGRYDELTLYADTGTTEAIKIIREIELLNPWILLITTDHGLRQSDVLSKVSEEETYHIPLIICELGQTEG
ncbi:LTA synthase family protein, partial [Nitrospinae bacterium AH_259_B05_G02_I21]|nr:LTA synthase family protein [Nitrospinae bacterium AH_259_B05_G02_I21]